LGDDGEWFIVGRSFDGSSPDVSSAGFSQVVGDIFIGLMPLYTFLAWSRENDHVGLKSELEDKRAMSKRDGVSLGEGAEVLVTSGLFTGKRGVVQGVDKKGMAKVAIGKLVVQIKGTALKLA
jgi:hypothetical protein